jgi:hypothetical protein
VIGCHIIQRSHWCHIVLNVHAPTEDNKKRRRITEDKPDGVKNSFYEELECVFDKRGHF